jgi:acyl-coenzyme A thioesterase PaaI-like protein
MTAQIDERFNNGIGIIHGGYAATLLDSAMGSAVNRMMPAGRIFTTLEMRSITCVRCGLKACGAPQS